MTTFQGKIQPLNFFSCRYNQLTCLVQVCENLYNIWSKYCSYELYHFVGENGTVDGQGRMWWELWWNRTLVHTRGHLLELMNSENVLVSNLTFRNSPFWTIHPVYCRSVLLQHILHSFLFKLILLRNIMDIFSVILCIDVLLYYIYWMPG